MSNSILYYPTIEFRHEDYQWLWNAALFADKIYRIVPPGYELNEPRNIRELCSTGEIGIPLSPVPNINNPYTYLAQIKSTFSYYPGASKLFGGQPQIAKYNYTLYRGFEEFIND